MPEDLVSQLEESQPTRKRVRETRRFDTTQLRENQHGQLIHRDYLAHVLRWHWVTRVSNNEARILDLGCGQDLPLVKMLSVKLQHVPSRYVGVDLNKLPDRQIKWVDLFGEFDFTSRYQEILEKHPAKFTVVTCFEVIEHMNLLDGARLLHAARECLSEEGRIYLSTPVFDGKAAANHVHEYTIPELHQLVQDCDLEVEKRYGTFANVKAIEKLLTPEEELVYYPMAEYFSNEVLSCLFAWNKPDYSRNNLWVLKKHQG